jgi:hypothetical protein
MLARIFALTLFALLAVTRPARAAIIEYVNLGFGNGYKPAFAVVIRSTVAHYRQEAGSGFHLSPLRSPSTGLRRRRMRPYPISAPHNSMRDAGSGIPDTVL